MARHGKTYGYTVALWEVDNTVPSLFRAVSDFKNEKRIKTTDLWRSMIKPSWLPLPFRWMRGSQPWRDASGDEWNLCHYWSNFEIADMEFFRSPQYRNFFAYLDSKGGFYTERVSIALLISFRLSSPKESLTQSETRSGVMLQCTRWLHMYFSNHISYITFRTLDTFMIHGESVLRMRKANSFRMRRSWEPGTGRKSKKVERAVGASAKLGRTFRVCVSTISSDLRIRSLGQM
jgi:hypothetical protein